MRTYRFILFLLPTLLAIVSCQKEETFEEQWKRENEAQFASIIGNTEYRKITSESSGGIIMYKVLQSGDGETPCFTDKVKVRYTGWYKNNWAMPDTYKDNLGNTIYNKIVFDSTKNRNDIPSTFAVNGLTDGFSTALQHMKVGDIWEVWVPWELGYGKKGNGTINGYTTLVFEIELVGVIRQ